MIDLDSVPGLSFGQRNRSFDLHQNTKFGLLAY